MVKKPVSETFPFLVKALPSKYLVVHARQTPKLVLYMKVAAAESLRLGYLQQGFFAQTMEYKHSFYRKISTVAPSLGT